LHIDPSNRLDWSGMSEILDRVMKNLINEDENKKIEK